MTHTFVQDAVRRVQSYLPNYDTDVPAEILADILHYCRVKEINFLEELTLAEAYVDEELSFMEHTV